MRDRPFGLAFRFLLMGMNFKRLDPLDMRNRMSRWVQLFEFIAMGPNLPMAHLVVVLGQHKILGLSWFAPSTNVGRLAIPLP